MGNKASQPAAAGQQAAAPAPPLPTRPRTKLPSDSEIQVLEKKLGREFKDPALLRQALIHPSAASDALNNSRLTWLGDSVLGAAVSDLLWHALPGGATAALHDNRAALVRCEACAAGAERLGLPALLVVGPGFEGEEATPRMLAECFEAVWGALYVDAGCSLAAVKEAYASLFPLPDPLAEAAKAEEREAADEAAVGGKVPATLL